MRELWPVYKWAFPSQFLHQMKFATVFLAAAVLAMPKGKTETAHDCKGDEIWSARFQECVKDVPHKKCKDDEKWVFARLECVKAKKCKGDEIFSYRYAQCIKLGKGKGH